MGRPTPATAKVAQNTQNTPPKKQEISDDELRRLVGERFGNTNSEPEAAKSNPDHDVRHTVTKTNGELLHLCADDKWRTDEEIREG